MPSPSAAAADGGPAWSEVQAALHRFVARRIDEPADAEDVVNDIDFPEEWARSEWMPQTYGCPEYVIRDIWRLETGWWDRNITSAHPAPVADSTAAIAAAISPM